MNQNVRVQFYTNLENSWKLTFQKTKNSGRKDQDKWKQIKLGAFD